MTKLTECSRSGLADTFQHSVHMSEANVLWNIAQVNLNGCFGSLLMKQPQDTKASRQLRNGLCRMVNHVQCRCQELQIPVSFCSTGSLNAALFVLFCCFLFFHFYCGQTVYNEYMMILILNKLLISHPSPSTPRILTDGLWSGSGCRHLPLWTHRPFTY